VSDIGHSTIGLPPNQPPPPSGAMDDEGPPPGTKIAILNLDIVTDVLLTSEEMEKPEKVDQKFKDRAREVLETLLFNLPAGKVVYNNERKMYTIIGITTPTEGKIPS